MENKLIQTELLGKMMKLFATCSENSTVYGSTQQELVQKQTNT